MHKINSTVVTLGLAGIVALAIGFYVNSVNWGPVGEEKTQAGTQEPASATATAAKPAATTPPANNTWAASATGRVEPKSGEIRVMADIPGRIEEIPAELNDVVKAGDLLVRLDAQDALTKVSAATAEASVRVRERDEEQVRGLALDRRNAEDAVANAERVVFGARQAFDDALQTEREGKGPDDAVSTARKTLEDSKKKLATARADLATVNAKSGMPLPTRLEAALAVARSELSSAELAVEHTRIRAPVDGTVLNVFAKEGEVAVPNPENTLLVLGDVSALKVRAEVEERDSAKIRVGQLVVVRADAFPDQDFEGRVSQIAKSLSAPRIATRGPRRPNDVEVLEAVADLDGLPPLLTGMRVDVFFKHDATASTK